MREVLLRKINKAKLTEENIKDLKKVTYYAHESRCKDNSTDIYALVDKLDNDQIKALFLLRSTGGTAISTMKCLDCGTNEAEQGKGYATKGFAMMVEEISNRPELERVSVEAFNPIAYKIIDRQKSKNIEKTGVGAIINNPNFDERYSELCKGIRSGEIAHDNVRGFCGDDEYMLTVANNWLMLSEQEKNRIQNKSVSDIKSLLTQRVKEL